MSGSSGTSGTGGSEGGGGGGHRRGPGGLFDDLAGVVRDMDDATPMSDSSYFGTPMVTSANIALAMADMHEHLGQLIASARANQVVPPWSS